MGKIQGIGVDVDRFRIVLFVEQLLSVSVVERNFLLIGNCAF